MLNEYKSGWQRRMRRQQRYWKELSEKALSEAERLADILKSRYQCEEVYLIGSLSRGEFREDSDLDLVVKGLKAEDYYKATGELLFASDFPVDLIPYEEANELLKSHVQFEGIRL